MQIKSVRSRILCWPTFYDSLVYTAALVIRVYKKFFVNVNKLNSFPPQFNPFFYLNKQVASNIVTGVIHDYALYASTLLTCL